MFYDLHIPWTSQVTELQQTLFFLAELGYNVVALTHTLAGKLPADLACPIPTQLPFEIPAGLRVLRRCNLILSDPAQNHRLQLLSNNYDILALRPTNEKALQQACLSLECDLISFDLTQRRDAHFKMKMLRSAIDRGVKFEICYGPAVSTADSAARRNLISHATQLIRATRGRGLIVSSEASKAASCRGPADVINLAAVWGLGQERGKEALDKLARSVVVSAQLKRSSFRGVIDVVCAGEKPEAAQEGSQSAAPAPNKRKADGQDPAIQGSDLLAPKISKRQQKKQKRALREAGSNGLSADAPSKEGDDGIL